MIAETTDLPTKYVKIVVTDDQGRYLIPGLPKAKYQVWVRGYGLVDSDSVDSLPGKRVNLKAVVAPTPQEAAKYYPASYWYSLIQVPAKSEFPMKPTPAPPYKAVDEKTGTSKQEGVTNEETVALQTTTMTSQEQWIDAMKQGCELCIRWAMCSARHQAPRSVSSNRRKRRGRPYSLRASRLSSDAERLSRFVDQQRAIKMFADWTDRIERAKFRRLPASTGHRTESRRDDVGLGQTIRPPA